MDGFVELSSCESGRTTPIIAIEQSLLCIDVCAFPVACKAKGNKQGVRCLDDVIGHLPRRVSDVIPLIISKSDLPVAYS